MRQLLFRLSLLHALALAPVPGRAAGELATAMAPAPSALPELPRLAPLSRPEPDPTALRELDRVLDEVTSHDARLRAGARAALGEPIPGIVDAVRVRVQDVRAALDRDAAPHVLADARKEARRVQRGQKGDEAKEEKKGGEDARKDAREPRKGGKSARKGGGDASEGARKEAGGASKAPGDAKKPQREEERGETEGDWLDFMLAMPRPKDSAWRDVVKLLAMERMLVATGTTPAVRELIALHAYFGELLRIDLQRQIAKLRDRAVPALIEARQHDAKLVQRWANKQLDLLGRAIPGEAIATNDTQILADTLRAYGRTRDVDAVRVILSFCDSDRVRLRDAAREAIAAIGEPGIWQLRDVYLNLTGDKPPREWSWDRIARELFATHDRARLAEVYRLMDEGVAAMNAGKRTEATDAFDKVLARAPLFERRKEMVKAYIDRAKSLGDDRREETLAMLRKALRLDPDGEQAKAIESEIAHLEGRLLIERGTPDKFVLKRALELAPDHAGARQALASLEDRRVERKSYTNRYLGAGAVGVAALLAMLFITRRRSKPEPPPEPTTPPSPPPAPVPPPPDA
jgi:tetratricopeptide (TPR) repeat protein